jgi:hypothetical protein
MSALPDHEPLSWWQLNSRLGLTDGEATFDAIHQVSSWVLICTLKMGGIVARPSLVSVAGSAGHSAP